MKKDDIVRIKKGYENSQEELSMRFTIIEAYDNKALIQPLEWKYAIVPTELVPIESIEQVITEQNDKE
jgi:hypothetical protein